MSVSRAPSDLCRLQSALRQPSLLPSTLQAEPLGLSLALGLPPTPTPVPPPAVQSMLLL